MAESGIVLCGGRSTRMGWNKAELRFGAESMLERVTRLVLSIATDVVVVAGPAQSIPAGLRAVRDPAEGLGPLAGLTTGLGAVAGARALLVACDMPLVEPALLRRLLELGGDADACVPRLNGLPMTTCAVYSTRVAATARQLVDGGRLSLRALLDVVAVRWVEADTLRELDPDLRSFHDCDTPERYHEALRLAGLGE